LSLWYLKLPARNRFLFRHSGVIVTPVKTGSIPNP